MQLIFVCWVCCCCSVVQSLSGVQLFMTPWTTAYQAPLSFTISQSLLKLMSIELMMPSNNLILCSPLLLPSIFPSIRVSFDESVLFRWPKHWSFSFCISPSNEYSGMIWSSYCLGDSPEPQFKSISSSALSLLYGPTITSIHDYWKNHSFDYTDLCQHSDVSAF